MVRRLARIACVLLVLVLGCDRASDRTTAPAASEPAPPPPAPPEFVGSARCAGCHASETQHWRGSQHDQAMQEATAETVLGDFGGARFEHFGATSSFFQRDGRYFVNTEGPDGARADFEIEYTFGVAPLQQYLVRLPGGRLQALNTAFDTRPRAAGGQRWFHLYPSEAVPASDVLHWTKPSQNWNAQCAECHSTNLRKGFDLAKDSYATSWSELDVGCESCHGPGSRHVTWADAAARGDAQGGHDLGLTLRFRESPPARWVFAEGAAIAHREPALPAQRELETCAPCHARRSTLREGRRAGEALLDTHRPALLEPGLYEADGQMRDEVYVHGSFVQSRMHAAGVICSDCHEPHSLALRAEGNALCAQCHRPEVFDVPAHHHHAAASAGAQCVACHLPARTYMGIDVRHDHSFRVPRPDLSVSIGTPNACNACHTHRSPRWAAAAAQRWFPNGHSGTPHYGVALDAGRRGLPGAESALAAVAEDPAQPGIVRATALSLLATRAGPAAAAAIRRGLTDPDALVRLGALEGARGLEPAAHVAVALPLLGDPRLAVRLEAARGLAETPPSLWRPADRTRLAGVLAEYRAALEIDSDRPDAHVNRGMLEIAQGDPEAARRSYETALRLAPWFVPSYVNLADLERLLQRDEAGEVWLRRALEVAPDVPEPHHALGLLLIRTGRRDEALSELARAAELAPGNARFALAFALVLDDRGERERALAVLEAALALHPGDRDLRLSAASLANALGRPEAALAHARALLGAFPDDPEARALLTELESASKP